MPDYPTIVCVPVSELAVPFVESQRRYCNRCGTAVWLSGGLQALADVDDARLVCGECAKALVVTEDWPVGELLPEDRQRLRDLGYLDWEIDMARHRFHQELRGEIDG
jgi:ribosomal protein S27AE